MKIELFCNEMKNKLSRLRKLRKTSSVENPVRMSCGKKNFIQDCVH